VKQLLVWELASNRDQISGVAYLCVGVDIEAGDGGVESRDVRDVVIFPLTLLFLELEGDASDRTFLNTLHEMGCEPSDFVPETF
jgi:hypothetical protein